MMEKTNPAQNFVLTSRMLDSKFSCVLQLPTGAGKTWLARRAIHASLGRGFRAVYITPLRALANELLPIWQEEFSPYTIGIFTGDYGKPGREYPASFAEARLLIMTPERLDACTRAWRSHWHWIPETDLIVVDEIHLLGERNRGARLEGAMGRFRRLNPFCRFLCLSATLGNREQIADWLEGIEYESSWRPVPLTWRITRFQKAEEKPGLLVQEIEQARAAGGRSLVFVQSRRRSEQLAEFLSSHGIRASYHHAGLTHKERRKVEYGFGASEYDAVIATATLEMGLNLPVRQVILYDIQAFDGIRFIPLSVSTVWQRAGRAGRPGLDTVGEAVLFAPAWDREVERYPAGGFERVESTLALPGALSEQVVAEVSSGLCRSEAQLESALRKTLASFQDKTLMIQQTISEMTRAEMIRFEESENDSLHGKPRLIATPLGRIASRHLLQPNTILVIRIILDELPRFTQFDALFSLGLTPDCEPVIPVDFEELPALSGKLSGIPSHAVVRLQEIRNQVPGLNGKRVLSALKVAAMLLESSQGIEDDKVAQEFGIYAFELVRLRESYDRLLRAAGEICMQLFGLSPYTGVARSPLKPDAARRLELLHHMVLNRLSAQTATLTLLNGIGSKWAKRLADLGFSDVHSLAAATADKLAKIPGLSRKRAAQWLAEAETIAASPIPNTEYGAPQIGCAADSCDENIEGYDPYRLRRAVDLAVSVLASGGYLVTGGLEPHRVQSHGIALSCDCVDFAKGNVCKHILAVKRANSTVRESGNPSTILSMEQPENLNLFHLWSES